MIKTAVEAAVGNELFMIALFDDVTFLQDENGIGILNGGETVGDDKAGASLHQRIHRFLNADLGA